MFLFSHVLGDHTKISLKTRNVFIECTGTDITKVNESFLLLICFNIIVFPLDNRAPIQRPTTTRHLLYGASIPIQKTGIPWKEFQASSIDSIMFSLNFDFTVSLC